MSEQQEISVSQVSFGTIFKLIFWAGACMWGVISVLTLFAAFVAPGAISVNGQQATTTGQALLAVPIFLVIGLVFSAIGAAIGGGLLKALARFLPIGTIRLSS